MLCLAAKKTEVNSAFQLMFCGGKVVEVSVCVVFGWQETERKGEKINWGFILFFRK